MEEHGYRTVGEMIYKDAYFHTECAWADNGYLLTPRNKADDYSHTMLRALLEEEVHILFECQRKFGNEKATEKLEQDRDSRQTERRALMQWRDLEIRSDIVH